VAARGSSEPVAGTTESQPGSYQAELATLDFLEALHEPRSQIRIKSCTPSEHARREVRSDSAEVAAANQFAKQAPIPAAAV